MKISAVIPCYNGSKFIEEAIESINQQTFRPIEILVVNDGSTDDTLNILYRLQQANPIPLVIINQINYGVSVARNVGIAESSGEWIAFLDVDDIWLPNLLNEKRLLAQKLGMTQGLICHNYYEDDTSDKGNKHLHSSIAPSVHNKKINGREFQKYLLKEFFIGTATAMMFTRLDALRIGGFDSFMKHSEDFDFVLRFTCIQDVLVLSEPLAVKRHHGENLSNDKELYFYSHGFSCRKNLLYDEEYSRGVFDAEIKNVMKKDSDYFITGYCNQIYEKNAAAGLLKYLKLFYYIRTWPGFSYHVFSFAKKIVRTLSLGLIKRRVEN